MELTEVQVKKFQTIYENHFGIKISSQEAYKSGMALLVLMKNIYKPISKGELEKLNENEDYRNRNITGNS